MVSAVSSQAATLIPSPIRLSRGRQLKSALGNATPTDSDRGPATQVSLSPDALDRLMPLQQALTLHIKP